MHIKAASAASYSAQNSGKENTLFSWSIQMNEVEGGRTQGLCSVLIWPLGDSVTPWGPCLLPAQD